MSPLSKRLRRERKYNRDGATHNERVGDVVVCDRHSNSTGQWHINPTGKGHTTGGAEGGSQPSISNNMIVVHKGYTIDYTSALKNVIMEEEHEAGILTYRYVYGLDKAHVVIYEGEAPTGGIQAFSAGPDAATVTYAMDGYGQWAFEFSDEFPLSEIMETFDYGGGGQLIPFSAGSGGTIHAHAPINPQHKPKTQLAARI